MNQHEASVLRKLIDRHPAWGVVALFIMKPRSTRLLASVATTLVVGAGAALKWLL
jgi:hypothetical protein